MNCLDAREQFPAVVAGMSSLSEWAPVEAHVGKCAECQKILERLYRTKPRNEPGWARPSPKPVDQPEESTSILEIVSPSRRPQHHALWAVLVAAAVTLGAGAWLAGYGSRQSVESALVALLEGVRSGIHQAEVLVAPPRPLVSAPPAAPPRNSPPQTAPVPPPSPPAATVPTAPAAPLASTRPESLARNSVPETAPVPPPHAPETTVPTPPAPPLASSAVSPPRNSVPETAAATPRRSAPETRAVPRPSPPAIAAEPKAIRPTKGVSAPASLPSRVSKSPRSIPDKSAAVSKPTPEAAPDPSTLMEIGKIDVAVQLSVSNRKDAERDFGMLLARVGGTKLGPGQTSTLTASVPRSSYSEFTRGLSQIGSWRLEAGAPPYPIPYT